MLPVRLSVCQALLLILGVAGASVAQELPKSLPTKEQLANDNALFLKLARTALKWDVPAEPLKIVGPIYFVGTAGLGCFLFDTSDGLILMNTGMEESGPLIEDSIRKLGFRPENLKLMINGHAHADHAGAFAYLREKYGAPLAVMDADVEQMENGDSKDFKYGSDLSFPPVKVDRVLSDGEQIAMGDIMLTAYLTPGHTKGSTTWVAHIVADGKAYVVAFPDGAGFNPGYRVLKNPSYPGIAGNYRRTHHFLEMLKPDIWLAQHNEYYDLAGKSERAKTEGVAAWVDPEGYRRFIAGKKRAFEDLADEEMGVPAAVGK